MRWEASGLLVVLVKYDEGDKTQGDKTKYEMGRACCTHQRDNKCIHNLVEKPQGTKPLGRPRNRRNNTETHLVTNGMCVDWSHVAQYLDRRQNLVNTKAESLVYTKCGEFLD